MLSLAINLLPVLVTSSLNGSFDVFERYLNVDINLAFSLFVI